MHLLYTLFLAALPVIYAASSPNTPTCPISPYTNVDLNKLSGTWYAVRGIEHNRGRQTTRQRNNKSCPLITLSVTDSTHVVFSYDSKNGSEPRQYNLTVRDTALPSVWTIEKGSRKHVPFNKLQINDISDNTMALTMCGTQRLATVILSREKRFDSTTVETITQRLSEKGLNSARSFDRCKT
ncbi:uncharacterized protein LOC124359088 [Homalodisca vitripennis]|uniref:uncharacterized protein LOC124359088 n=1 Tax=Homalodisca vitripennis TaxID=197043 RepID=UPI001EEB03E4|nr:uncharacterized protein LOC124359088 [Homalodisca vitripennis]